MQLAGAAAGDQIRFVVEGEVNRPRLLLRLSGRNSIVDNDSQRVVVRVNGRRAAVVTVREGMHDYSVDLEREILSAPTLLVEIEASHAEAVFDADHNVVDARLLGLAIGGIGIFEGGEQWLPAALDAVDEANTASDKGAEA